MAKFITGIASDRLIQVKPNPSQNKNSGGEMNKINIKKHSSILLSFVFLSLFSIASMAKPVEIAFQKQKISSVQQSQLCELLKEACQDQVQWQFYKAKQHYYLINQLKLYQFSMDSQQHLQLEQQWDFSIYQSDTQHPRWATLLDQENQLSIFPKLFPINAHDYAIGIVQTWNEGYSGGGMSEEVADFVQLKPNGQYVQVFQNIPLSMYRMIRACFSEADYVEAKQQCHDEYQLDTQIDYVKPGTWKVKYHYQIDYSPASDTGEKPFSEYKSFLLERNAADAIVLPKAWLDN